MRVGYDSKNKQVILLAYPEELEDLAKKMRQQEASAIGGDDTTVITLQSEDFWTSQPTDVTLDIAYRQRF